MTNSSIGIVELCTLQERCLTTSDKEEWRKQLPASRSVFGSVEYATVCEKFRGFVPRLYVVKSDVASICHPMLLRPVSDLPFAVSVGGKWDSTTPDYTGPLVHGRDDDLFEQFSYLHAAFARGHGIIAEFAHLHPWSGGRELLREGCEYNRDIVWIDVRQSPKHIFERDLDRSCRNKIRKAQRSGVRIVADSSDRALHEFYRIYAGTMRRNQALNSYYLPLEFFRAIRDTLPENARFVFAEHSGNTVAAYLYMHDDKDVFSFLGGADADFSHLAPTNLVVWDTIEWAHQAGKRRLILGAGYRPNDGVYQFKASFSPLRQPFHVYKRIHRQDDFARLDQRCREYTGIGDENVDFFPSYRCVTR